MRLAMTASTLLLLALATAPVCAQEASAAPSVAPITLPPELDRVLRDYERHWRARDMPALAALFVEDGFVPSRQGWVRGHAGIQSRYASMAGGELRLSALAYSTSATVGYIVGTYGYGAAAHTGKFVLALKRTANGPWLIAADIDQ